MGRAPCCDKNNVKRGPWSPEEDSTLKSYIEKHGTGGNWIALPQKIGLRRCGKSCRLRWLNYLRPNIKHGGFSDEEDNIICSLYNSIGSRWSIIAAQLPGRTDNDIKNYWNTRLKKKLQRKDQQARRARLLRQNTINRENGGDVSFVAQNQLMVSELAPYWQATTNSNIQHTNDHIISHLYMNTINQSCLQQQFENNNYSYNVHPIMFDDGLGELEGFFYENLQGSSNELERLGHEMNNAGSITPWTTGSAESVWLDESCLVYPPTMIANFEALQHEQGVMLQNTTFDNSRTMSYVVG